MNTENNDRIEYLIGRYEYEIDQLEQRIEIMRALMDSFRKGNNRSTQKW